VLVFWGHFITVTEHKLSAGKGMGTYFTANQQNAIKYVYGKCKHVKRHKGAYTQKGKQEVTLLSVPERVLST
jgi:hypothetical protein